MATNRPALPITPPIVGYDDPGVKAGYDAVTMAWMRTAARELAKLPEFRAIFDTLAQNLIDVAKWLDTPDGDDSRGA